MLAYLFLSLLIANHSYCSPTNTDVIKSSNDVSSVMYQILAVDPGNVLFCPVSSNLLLSLVTLGAKGKTYEELRTGLQLPWNKQVIKTGYQNLLQQLSNDTLKLATRIFPRTGITLNPNFSKTAQTYFQSDVQEVDYNYPTNAAETINKFVENRTNNKIKDLISSDSIGPDTTLILVNAAHFKNDWLEPFEFEYGGDFYVNKDSPVTTTLMTATSNYSYKDSASLNAKVLEIPFKNNNYTMIFILPNEVDGLQSLENKLAVTSIGQIRKNLISTRIEVTIPKYKIEAKLDLKGVLQKMGIKTVFTDAADLSGIISGPPVAVSDALQKTYINVNKEGVEAAAATGITISVTSVSQTPPVIFKADHPFSFAILYKHLIIFQGRLSAV